MLFLFPHISKARWEIMFLTLCILLLHGASGGDTDEVSAMEGDSVTLNTGVETNQKDRIMWYFSETRIAKIIGSQSSICSDAECPERFRDRLELDHVTASLTIMNISTKDSGPYHLQINNRNQEKVFIVSVHDAPAVDRDEIKSVKEGESVNLDPGVINNTNDLMTWLFKDVRIAEINGDPSKTCTDVQCEDANGSFRGRLKVDQTGSLTVTNTRPTDSGVYKLQIYSSRISFSIRRSRSFSVTVTGSSLSSAAVAGICAAVLILLMATAAAIYYLKQKKCSKADQGQVKVVKYSRTDQTVAANGVISKTESATETPA